MTNALLACEVHLQLTAVGDDQLLGGGAALGAVRFDLLNDVHAVGHTTEDDVLAI